MNQIDSIGQLLLTTLEIPPENITKELVFDILSIQNSVSPYTCLDSQEMRWKIQGKKSQGGHLDLEQFKRRISTLEI